MKLKVMIVMLVVVSLICAACGSASGGSAAPAETQAAAPVETQAAAPAETQAAAPAAQTEAQPAPAATEPAAPETEEPEDDEIVEITVMKSYSGDIPEGLPEVVDAINAITESQIHVHINYELLQVGTYIQQVSLMLSSQEPVDLVLSFPKGPITFNAMQGQNQIQDITDLLQTYGQDILSTMGDYMKATTLAGRTYGVPVYRNYAAQVYVCMRTDVLEDLNLVEDARNMTCLKDLEKILEAVHSSDKWGELSGLVPSSGDGAIAYMSNSVIGIEDTNHISYDPLAASSLIGIDETGDDLSVKLIPDTDGYREVCHLVQDWYNKGYIYKDSSTAVESGTELLAAGKAFACIQQGELGKEASMEAATKMKMTCVPLLDVPITTSTVVMVTWCVPMSAQEPEAAIKFLNLLYTNEELSNLFAWGIEGRDYVVEDGIAKYPEDNGQLYHASDWDFGNMFLVLPWDGSEADIRSMALEAIKNAPLSPCLGFVFNQDAVADEIAAISNAKEEYYPQVNSGVVGDDVLDEYIQKLYDCGAQKVMDELQAQLDAWYEVNK